MILTLLISALAAYMLWTVVALELNIRRASSMNIPCVRLPIDSDNVLWMIVEPYIWKIVDALPFDWLSYPASIRHLRRGWHFREKAFSHLQRGPIWALVSPVKVNLHLSDPDAIGDIFSRRRDFIRPIANYKILEVYGPCISTVEVDDWPRHRKALAAPFSESAMSHVWDESIRQSDSMTGAWSNLREGIPSFQSDTRSVSLNVLAFTGFQQSYDFEAATGRQEDKPETALDYRGALQIVLDNAILLMLVPYRILVFPIMPESWRRIGQAGVLFKGYMDQILNEELEASKEGGPGAKGILASFLNALSIHQEDDRGNSGQSTKIKKGLSMEEVLGNIFAINFAGHDTTANTLAFAFLLLATEPDVQDWMARQVQEVVGEKQIGPGSYKELFPLLLRCRAVLYETVRLYPPIMALPKATDHRSQNLKIAGRDMSILPNTTVTLSILACHTHPDTWTDSLTWKPSRWIVPSPDGEQFYTPPDNTFFPWSNGHMNCPGKKFAEVEFIAVMARVFRDHRVEIKRLDGESVLEARERARETINDINMEMLLRMKDADRVQLICKPRAKNE